MKSPASLWECAKPFALCIWRGARSGSGSALTGGAPTGSVNTTAGSAGKATGSAGKTKREGLRALLKGDRLMARRRICTD